MQNEIQLQTNANWQQVLKNEFPTDRGLRRPSTTAGTSYLSYRGFGPALRSELSKLKKKEVWLDIGGGELFAQKEFLEQNYAKGKNVIAGAVAVADPNTEDFRQNQSHLSREYSHRFFYQSGRRIEDIPVDELPQAKVVSDLFAALSFTEQIDLTLQRELDALEVGGTLIARLQKAYIRDSENKRVGIKRYASLIRGAETLLYGWYTLVMRKNEQEVVVPPLTLINFVAGENAPNPSGLDPQFLFCERYYSLTSSVK